MFGVMYYLVLSHNPYKGQQVLYRLVFALGFASQATYRQLRQETFLKYESFSLPLHFDVYSEKTISFSHHNYSTVNIRCLSRKLKNVLSTVTGFILRLLSV